VSSVEIDQNLLAGFCRRHHIRKLSLFGSRSRGEQRPESDLDLLVEFEEGHVPGFAIARIERELSEMLHYRVDLRTPAELNRRFRQHVVSTAELLYAAE
jgi:uncharacterized protein